jgi:uncharacterized protein
VTRTAPSSACRSRYQLANDYHAQAVDDSLGASSRRPCCARYAPRPCDNADGHGIQVFSENLKNLLLSAPIKGTRVLGVDPGIRTGTKCAAIDETGKFLGYFMMYQEQKFEEVRRPSPRLSRTTPYSWKLSPWATAPVATTCRSLVSEAMTELGGESKYAVVDEDGASVYSASDVAREEFPELDLTIRGAISIGRRIQDPLAELVKIDPKSIGVGLYQHDVNQKRLSESVDEVVESVVNRVGVNINTASHSLLKYVSGINSSLAKKIVKYRDDNGVIKSRDELKNVSGMGEKSYEQCAGFFKIPESPNPLDNTWVHPERYPLAGEILPLVRSGKDPQGAAGRPQGQVRRGRHDDRRHTPELKKPNRDPSRRLSQAHAVQQGVLAFEDLKEGMKVTGKVKNVVDFGAFVDIGIKESALIHVSELSDQFVKDPMDVLKVGDVKEFRIISLDVARKRIGLSLKSERRPDSAGSGGQRQARKPEGQSSAADSRVPVPGQRTEPQRGQSSAYGGGGQRGGTGGYSGGGQSSARGQISKPATERDDDGTSYNPFADLLKNRK